MGADRDGSGALMQIMELMDLLHRATPSAYPKGQPAAELDAAHRGAHAG